MAIYQMPSIPSGRCSAIPCQLMPAPQYNEGADNGCDDAGSLTRAIQMNRAAEKSRHYTSDNSQYSRQDEACGLLGEGEIHLAMKPAIAPTMIAQTICMFLSYTVWQVTIAHEWVRTDWRQDPRIPSSRLVISAPSDGRAALPALPMQPRPKWVTASA
jgi:hypothetical protein